MKFWNWYKGWIKEQQKALFNLKRWDIIYYLCCFGFGFGNIGLLILSLIVSPYFLVGLGLLPLEWGFAAYSLKKSLGDLL